MTISFSCPRCAAHFKVPESAAERKARCKKCGHALQVPAAPAKIGAAAVSGVFRLGAVQPAAVQVGANGGVANGDIATSPPAEVAGPGRLRLAPMSEELVSPLAADLSAALAAADSGDYELEKPAPSPKAKKPPRLLDKNRSGPARAGPFEWLVLALRKISDVAYLVTIPCILLLLLAVVLKQRELSILAALLVVLLNIGRLVMDGLALFALAFKNGLVQGVLFFIPPFTFYYLSKRGRVMKEALTRFLAPALPILGVLLLFAFVPWLRGTDAAQQATSGAPSPAAQDTPDAQTPGATEE